MILRWVFVALLCLVHAACSQPVRPVTAAGASKHVLERNYELGRTQNALVGEPVVRIKDYYVTVRRSPHMTPSTSFRVRPGVAAWVSVAADESLPVTGTISIDGTEYLRVRVKTGGHGLAVLVGPAGRPYERLIENDSYVFVRDVAVFEPEEITFRPGPDEVRVSSTPEFRSFELVYGGTDGKLFTLTYREYSPDDFIRPALKKNLTYPNDSTSVRFGSTRLTIQQITGEKITYTVVEDDSAAIK